MYIVGRFGRMMGEYTSFQEKTKQRVSSIENKVGGAAQVIEWNTK